MASDGYLETIVTLRSAIEKCITLRLNYKNNNLLLDQKDNSTLMSEISFDEMHDMKPDLLRGIKQIGFANPTEVQGTVLMAVLKYSPYNFLVQSEPGTGKTATFGLGILNRVVVTEKYPQAIVFTPTLETAVQIKENLENIAKFCPEIRIILAIKGQKVQTNEQIRHHIIVGTAGTIVRWSRYNFDISKLGIVVFDDWDWTLGNYSTTYICQELLRKLEPYTQKTFVSSLLTEPLLDWAETMFGPFMVFESKANTGDQPEAKFYNLICRSEADMIYYTAFICLEIEKRGDKTIVFFPNKMKAPWVIQQLKDHKINASLISGRRTPSNGLKNIQRFRSGQIKTLVTTNIMSRGLDFPDVACIVIFDQQLTENVQHDRNLNKVRAGRTGRFGNSGIVMNMIRKQ